MEPRQVVCPECGQRLRVPPEYLDRLVRCRRCSRQFRAAPAVSNVTEDDILQWLTEADDMEEPAAPVETVQSQPVQRAAAEVAVAPTMEPLGEEGGEMAGGAKIRLVKIEPTGEALFEFPAGRLLETEFRCAMPRRCLRCGNKAHLQAHVIIYAHQLPHGVSLEAEHAAGALFLTEQETRGLTNEELLARLPQVPNAPHPGDVPMPYWLCDLCTPGNVISGQIQVNTATGEGRCRLLVRNFRRAEEFMVAAGGEGAPGYTDLHDRVAATIERPWDRLPLIVQDRVRQWFKPAEGEHYLAYVPDRDHMRTEDGVAGLVISNKRLIYHTQMRHRECNVGDSLELQLAMTGKTGRLRIFTHSWEVKHLPVDRDGISRLRYALTVGKFHAAWH